MSPTPDITLYTAQTPNGIKISILLEELGLPYKVEKIDLGKNVQKEDWFLKINPNGRIPALTDAAFPADGKPISPFESGAIMLYLTDTYDKDHKVSFPQGSREHYEMVSWLFFLNAGVGPMQGQANHFVRYAPEKIEYGMNRYKNETRRLYGVLDAHLAGGRDYLVGDGKKCSVADIAHYGWIAAAGWAGVDIAEFPHLERWEQRMEAREGVKKGRDVPTPLRLKEILKDQAKADQHAKQASSWVQAGMKEDAAKKR